MKKIININLSGRVIPIEDSAYEKLQSYIESLRRYFAHEEGRDEIINDIESRIAELMNDKVRKGATCVTEADVEEIAASMGRPEDFEAESAEYNTDSTSGGSGAADTQAPPRAKGRLYRDSSDKFIGGVCSGIANYLNIDPAIVRILFAIVTFGGFGIGFLIYILLWMILPDKSLEGYSGKRLFRNPDERILGGVAGGLGAYFNAKVSTIRLIFAAPLILSALLSILDRLTFDNNFDFFPNLISGSLSGTFILIYIVLWIVLPEARGPYEKMEMRGEKVDVNSIRQNVKDGMGNVKDRMKNWSEEVKDSAQNFSTRAREFTNTRGRAFADEVSQTARSGGRGIGHAIGVLFKVFVLFIAGTIAFAIFVALIALLFGGVAWWPINNFLWTSKWQQIYAWGTLIFFLVIPLIAFITWVIRRMLRVRSKNSYLGWTFGFLWTVGWVSMVLLATSMTRDHSQHEFNPTAVQTMQPTNGRMTVTVSEPELSYTGRFDWINDGGEGWDLTNDTMKLSNVDFDFIKSEDSNYHVTVKAYSWGRTEEEALRRAEKIEYRVVSADSILDIASGYAIHRDSKFRWQHVVLEIRIPVGKKIRFDRSVHEKLNPGNFDFKGSRSTNREWYERRDGKRVSYYSSNYLRENVDYVMSAEGRLTDLSGGHPVETNNDDYRYESPDSLERIRLIEQKRKELKELEEQQNRRQSSEEVESMDDREETATRYPNPVFSVVNCFF